MLPAEKAGPLVKKIVRASDDFTLDPVLLASLRIQAAEQVLELQSKQ